MTNDYSLQDTHSLFLLHILIHKYDNIDISLKFLFLNHKICVPIII